MPRCNDIHSVMVLGSGPIIIGQACEFDYSGTQGCKALKEEGCRVILLNSNPATVMTDPGFSDRTYLEPLNIHMASAIIRQERPDALLPTLGGQTALNLAMELHHSGILEECGVRMIGAQPASIELAENRQMFRDAMHKAGLDLPRSGLAESVAEAEKLLDLVKFPAIVRPSYTLGGTGGGIAYNLEEFRNIVRQGLYASPIGQVLVEESVLGWKEMELELVRDKADNAIVVCGIENVDPMGVHTGDSITVAPIQTLSDVEYQALRNDALTVVRTVGVDTGGCNIQFAVSPETGRRVVIEMNPRVSRSSALASKATGYPIARVAAKLALGYHLDELKNDITGTSACFEPSIDYCVVKVPRFNFEKFTGSVPLLGLQMHSVGETMALGGNFREALQKALRGLETGLSGLEALPPERGENPSRGGRLCALREKLLTSSPDRLLHLYEALQLGLSCEDAHSITGIDLWFVLQMQQIAGVESSIGSELAPLIAPFAAGVQNASARLVTEGEDDSSTNIEEQDAQPELARMLRRIKAQGFSDARIAALLRQALPDADMPEERLRAVRLSLGVRPVFRSVDTCAGEFIALTPYFYSTYDGEASDPPQTGSRKDAASRPSKVIILGGGPNRIGQGVEFDYCCVQACLALKGIGITPIMVNSNPETVSTDYDTAGSLYFEPLTEEDILAVCEAEQPDGVIVQLGGQTPLNLAAALEKAGIPILGTRPSDIALAEDREAFDALVESLGIPRPPSGMAGNEESACRIAKEIGYPVMIRPSFVLGGRSMRIVHHEEELRAAVSGRLTGYSLDPAAPVLVDKYLEDAVEVDVDAVGDGKSVTIAAIMEHIEQAGVHSGDSCCSIPTHTLAPEILDTIRRHTHSLGMGLNVVGLLNVQFAIRAGTVYVIEANPRGSRTVPFVSKTIGRNVAGMAAMVMTGATLDMLGFTKEPAVCYHAVKEAVIPFERFPGTEIVLGPEMRSTGEVMGIDRSFGMAFLKAQSAAGTPVPYSGNVVLSVTDRDKPALIPLAERLVKLGFTLYATPGTLAVLVQNGIPVNLVVKIGPLRPHLIDFMRNGDAHMIVNTISGASSARDATTIRAEALARRITLMTTLAALTAAVEGLEARQTDTRSVAPLQDYYAGIVEGVVLC